MKPGMLMAASLLVWGTPQASSRPTVVDYHQHLFSPAITNSGATRPVVSAEDLVALLDAAGIRKGLVLSLAYQYGNPNRPAVQNEYEKVKAENDWTSEQVARYPDRLRGFCSINPLKEYALDEIARCGKDSQLRRGLKMHFGNSDVDLSDRVPNDRVECGALYAAGVAAHGPSGSPSVTVEGAAPATAHFQNDDDSE
jgi:predicted TIM-barrel fold metal-dependent hydrolase